MKDYIMREIKIDNGICFHCGKGFTSVRDKKTINHALPQCLKPKFNVLFPMHESCHKELNSLYAGQQKKPKVPVNLNNFRLKLNKLVKVKDNMEKNLMELIGKVDEDIENIKDSNKLPKGANVDGYPSEI